MFKQIEEINTRPEPFQVYTAADLWTDEHTSKQMLRFHLDEELDASSRSIAFIDRSVDWIISRFNIDAEKKIAVVPGYIPQGWPEGMRGSPA